MGPSFLTDTRIVSLNFVPLFYKAFQDAYQGYSLTLTLLLCLQGLLVHIFCYFPDSWVFFRKKCWNFHKFIY